MIAHDYVVKIDFSNRNDLPDATDCHSLDCRNDYQRLVGHSRYVRVRHDDVHVSLPERSRSRLNRRAHLSPNCFREQVARAW